MIYFLTFLLLIIKTIHFIFKRQLNFKLFILNIFRKIKLKVKTFISVIITNKLKCILCILIYFYILILLKYKYIIL